MNTITATYRVVTPMFLSGADQNSAELRVPSFKGALRFWWRALAAACVGNDIGALRQTEDALFGSADGGQSRVHMRLADVHITTGNQAKFPRNSWQSYTGFGLIDKPGQTQREFIKPNSTFTVQLSCARCGNAQRSEVADALIALGLFGGLGSRSRNGWGSLTLESMEGNAQPWHVPTTVEALRNELRARFTHTGTAASWSAITDQSLFEIGTAHDSSEAAHRWLATHYQNAVKELAQDKSRREAFGLPRNNAGKNAGARRAGPVFLHVHQTQGEQAIPLALCLPAQFLPQQAEPAGGWQAAAALVEGMAQG